MRSCGYHKQKLIVSCFKLHHPVIFIRESDGHKFPRHTTLFFAHVCSQDVEQDQVPHSTSYMGLCAPETLSAQTGSLKPLSMFFTLYLNQMSTKRILAAEKSRNYLCLHAFFLRWVDRVSAQPKTCPILYNSVQSKLKCPDKSNANYQRSCRE